MLKRITPPAEGLAFLIPEGIVGVFQLLVPLSRAREGTEKDTHCLSGLHQILPR